MTSKFNPKKFQNKTRIYAPVPGAQLLARVYEWDVGRQEYRDPPRGHRYLARRRELVEGKKVLKAKAFATLDEARNWQTRMDDLATNPKSVSPKNTLHRFADHEAVSAKPSPLFGEIVDEWRRRTFAKLSKSTQAVYERYLRLHFQSLMGLPVRSFTARLVDEWIDERKRFIGQSAQSRQRSSFEHELTLLGSVLRYYVEYHDDVDFRLPIKKRHREAAIVAKDVGAGKTKDLSCDEFMRFRAELLNGPHPLVIAALATVQYFQALRISEAAAIHWEDVTLDWKKPQNSRLRICRHVIFMRGRGTESYIEAGFKNASKDEPVKEQPLFPESFEAFKTLFQIGGGGLVFKQDEGTFLSYREIQHAYDHAFGRAGLPYRGTHVLRHGGTRNLYNETGDLAVAQQLLGNSDLKTTLVYAKRQKGALTKVAEQHWERTKSRPQGIAAKGG